VRGPECRRPRCSLSENLGGHPFSIEEQAHDDAGNQYHERTRQRIAGSVRTARSVIGYRGKQCRGGAEGESCHRGNQRDDRDEGRLDWECRPEPRDQPADHDADSRQD